jgi:sugar lactone lactonase YvrE
VTITATSHAYNLNPSLVANPATATIAITASESIAFTQQPGASVATNGTASVSAYVTNDAATGGGITWTVQCTNTADGACGYIQPYQTANGATATYVAPPVPPGVPVYIKATSTALSSATALSNAITIVASTTHSISFVPFVPTKMQVDTSVNLIAAVTNDSSNSGVDWSVCGSGCGYFTTQPAQAAIPAVPPSAGDPGSPAVPAVAAVTATSVQGWPNGLPIPYTAPAVAPEEGLQITASATADRLNNISPAATAVSTITISSDATGPALHGVVQAGTQPVVGATVYLYAAGTSGYASASVPISSPAATSIITTDSAGGFTIPAGYSCPQLTSQVYLVASGGKVGSAEVNSNLALMTALGPCSNLSSTTVVVNEVTTVASAAALATFSADNIQTGELSYQYIGSSSANSTVGLANAFASVNNLVNITTGEPKFWTVAGNAAVPYVTINTLADALNACAVTLGGGYGDGTACGNLFTYTDPLSAFSSYAPTDTLQAIIDLLKPPSPNIEDELLPSSVLGLVSKSSPYQPILSSAPKTEWSLSLNYTSGGGVGGSGATASGSSALAVDASGNIWITNQSINSVSEWSGLGAAYSPNTSGSTSGGFTAGGIYAPTAIAIDPSGYIWIVNGNGTLTKLDSVGTTVTGSTFSGGGLSTTGAGIAIDGSGNIWVTSGGSPGSVAKFNSRGIAQSPSTGYTSGIDDPSAIAIDASGNVWVYDQKTLGGNLNSALAELNNANGSLTIGVSVPLSSIPQQLAIDKSGNVWFGGGNNGLQLNEVVGGNNGTSVTAYNTYSTSYIGEPEGMAVDGSNRLWVASAGVSTSNISPNLSLFDSSNSGGDGDYADTNFFNGAPSVAVDASGNVWVLTSNNTVAEFVGLAAPVVTPLSAGVKNNKLGTKP